MARLSRSMRNESAENSMITGKRWAGRSQSRLFCTVGRLPGAGGWPTLTP
jgi:hypothetical protein